MLWHTKDVTLSRSLCLLIVGMFLFGCASRYRLNLYITSEGVTKKVEVEKTEFLVGSALNDPYAQEKTVADSSNTVVVTTGARWQKPVDKRVFMFGFDEYLRCRIYIQLPPTPVADTIDLQSHSFVHVLGRYDLPAADKIFLPSSGVFIVDSITTKDLFGAIHGIYKNSSGAPLAFEGQFKVKVRD